MGGQSSFPRWAETDRKGDAVVGMGPWSSTGGPEPLFVLCIVGYPFQGNLRLPHGVPALK